MKAPVTLYDVARRAGVSHTCVALVMNRSSYRGEVSERTAERVRWMAAKMGYVPNRTARCLALRKSNTIVVATNASLVHPYTNQMVEELHAALARQGYQMNMELLHRTPNEAEVYRTFTPGRYDGVVMMGMTPMAYEKLPEVRRAGLPVVAVHAETDGRLSSVDYDRVEAVRLGVTHLLAQGRKRIAMIYDIKRDGVQQQRRRGYRAALRDAGVAFDPNRLFASVVRGADCNALWARMSARRPIPDGLFCYNEELAAGMLHAIRAAHRRVPEDVAIVTQGNSVLTTLVDVPLTAVDHRYDAIAEAVVERLLEQMRDPHAPPGRTLVQPVLVIRQSTVGDVRETR